jgi:hypothetical protein
MLAELLVSGILYIDLWRSRRKRPGGAASGAESTV